VVAYVVLIVLLAIPAVPVYYFVEPAYKLLVIRVCAGIVLAFTLHRLVKILHEQLDEQPPSDFEAAARVSVGALSLAPQFEKLRDEVKNSVRSRSYFEHVLRLRLLALFEPRVRSRFGMSVADLAERPTEGLDPRLLPLLTHESPRRTLPRRRISRRELQALVQMLEERS